MAITVGVDSYVTVAEADAYHTARNNTGWNGSNAEKEADLKYATLYVDRRYSFVGEHNGSPGQPLAWPRLNAVDKQGVLRTGVPQEVKDAVCELALQLHADGRLLPAQDRGGAIKSVQAGSVGVTYMDGAPANKTFPLVDLMLERVTTGSRATVSLTRS